MIHSKILIIEDDEAVRENLKELLLAADYEPITAINGVEGLEIIAKIKPSLILCDISMPEMDGFEFIEILRKNPEYYSIPFLFLTALTDSKLHRKGMTLGADDYITKPYDSADLLTAIKYKIEKFEKLKKSFTPSEEKIAKNKSDIIPFEILSPLNSIRGFSQILINGCNEIDADEQKTILNIIKHSADRLIKLTENYTIMMMLEGSKELIATINDNPINIRKMISLTQGSLQNQYENKDLMIMMNVDDCFLYLPHLHLDKIVSEILENAYRYSLDHHTIYIEGKKLEEKYVFTVKNYTKGMNLKFIENLENFSFANTKEFEQQSYGLGLALVKKIVELYNGTFEVESVPYETTIIKVMLPLFVQF